MATWRQKALPIGSLKEKLPGVDRLVLRDPPFQRPEPLMEQSYLNGVRILLNKVLRHSSVLLLGPVLM